jgi:hypothetical protein
MEDLMRQLEAARVDSEALRQERDYFRGKADALEITSKFAQGPGGAESSKTKSPETNFDGEIPEFEDTFEYGSGRGTFRGRGRGFHRNVNFTREEPRGHGERETTRDDTDFKMDLPTFEGKLDPEVFIEWLQTIERNFDLKENVTDEKKIKLVATKLRGYASLWWDGLVEGEKDTDILVYVCGTE